MKRANYRLFAIILFFLCGLPAAAQTVLQEELDYRFAVELENRKLFDTAALQFERLAEAFPFSPRAAEALLRAGRNYERADSLTKAAQMYTALLLKYPQAPQNDQAQFSRAQLFAKSGDYLAAALAFERLRVLNPRSELVPQAQLEAARNFLAAGGYGRAADAASFLLETFAAHPLRLEARLIMAQVFEAKGDYDAALQQLDRLTAETLQDEFAARVYADKARLLRRTGRFARADSVLQKMVSGKFAGPVIGAAALQLAESKLALRDFQGFDQLIRDVLLKVDARSKAALQLLQADAAWLRQDWPLAKAALAQIDLALLSEPPSAYFFRLGMTEQRLGNSHAALEALRKAVADTSASIEVHHAAVLSLARLLAQTQPVEAVRSLQDHVERLNDAELRIETFFALAEIQETTLEDPEGARQYYQAVIAASPRSPLVDDAQYRIALTFIRQAQPRSALDACNRYLRYYPGGEFAAKCRRKAELLRLLVEGPPLFQPNASADDAALQFAQLDLYLRLDFQRAYRRLAEAAGNRMEALYERALCLAASLEFSQPNIEGAATADSLGSIALRLFDLDLRLPLTSCAVTWAAQAQLDASPEHGRRFLEGTISRLPQADPLRATLGRLLLETSEEAITETFLSELLSADDPAVRAPALIFAARRALPDSAAELLRLAYRINDPVVCLQAAFLLAQAEERAENLKAAKELYQEIVERGFYADMARKARARLVEILLNEGDYRAAERLVKEPRFGRVPRSLRFFLQDIDSEPVWLWAKVQQRTRPPHEAAPILLDYLELGRNVPHRSEALMAVAEMMEAMGREEIALGYYTEAAETATDSLGQRAMLKSAELAFNRGLYEKARDQYRRISEQMSEPYRRQALRQLIVCEYRLGNAGRASTLEKEFLKTYKDRNAEARFLYEAGLASMAKKEFDAAEKSFKSLAKYEDVPEGARGELGLAQLYVIQNKTEEALKRLTNIAEKYKDPEMKAVALVNLADFYYKNRQLENVLGAAGRVLELQPQGPLRAQALDLLINTYDDLNLRDKAIALEREYLTLYPYAPDALNRRIRIGVFLYGLKEYDRAIAHLKELRPLAGAESEAEVQYWIAKSYADAGLTETAVIEFLKVKYQCPPTRLPWGVTALYEAGQGYRKLGNLPKAREMFEQVVRERGITDNIGRAAAAKIQEIDEEMKKSS